MGLPELSFGESCGLDNAGFLLPGLVLDGEPSPGISPPPGWTGAPEPCGRFQFRVKCNRFIVFVRRALDRLCHTGSPGGHTEHECGRDAAPLPPLRRQGVGARPSCRSFHPAAILSCLTCAQTGRRVSLIMPRRVTSARSASRLRLRTDLRPTRARHLRTRWTRLCSGLRPCLGSSRS